METMTKMDKTTYMREWKRNDYANNKAKTQQRNKVYYYKYKFGLSDELMKKYGITLPYVAKIKEAVEEFKIADLSLSVSYLEDLLTELKAQQSL